jgi:FdrA protein
LALLVLTALAALKALEADPQTSVIAVISKPPAPATLVKLLDLFGTCTKPIVACFLGIDPANLEGSIGFHAAVTIDAAVNQAVQLLGIEPHGAVGAEWRQKLEKERAHISKEQVYLRGLFAGGTFCYQSQQILQHAGWKVYSNAPIDKQFKLSHPEQSREHTLVDMGDDFYTRGKPHPMIDGTWRKQRILSEANDPSVAVLLLDFILGYNASLDPVGDLLEAIIQAKKNVAERGGYFSVVASICGTDGDPQDLRLQSKMLEDAGVVLFSSNALAAKFCAELLQGR